jgi:GNAT superfamily N-acetyltransferase
MATAIQRLNEASRAILALHFLALPGPDRYLRFATAATPEFVARYVDGIDFERDAVLAIHAAAIGDEARRTLAGVVHAAYPDDSAELGVSVLPTYRSKGVASVLMQRAVADAVRRGVRRISMQFFALNAPMIRIARKLGMTLARNSMHVCARLELSRCHDGRPACDSRFECDARQQGLLPHRNLRIDHEQLV